MNFPFLKEALTNLFSKPSTVEFPKVNVEAKPGYRGRIAYDAEKCINCGMCIKVCSPGAITRTSEPVEGGDKITYTFDLTSCTFCAMCADFCTTKAIKLTDDYMIVGTKPEDFIVSASFVKKAPPPKPQFTPEQIAAMKAKAEAAKKAKEAAAAAAAAAAKEG